MKRTHLWPFIASLVLITACARSPGSPAPVLPEPPPVTVPSAPAERPPAAGNDQTEILPGKGEAQAALADGPYTIALYPGGLVSLTGPAGLIELRTEGGYPKWAAFKRAELPGGAVGYFIAGEEVGAYVSGSLAWRLFMRSSDGQFRQVIFTSTGEPFTPPEADFLRSMGTPRVEGEKIIATHGDDAGGKSTIKVIWQLVPGEAKAVQVERTQEMVDPRK